MNYDDYSWIKVKKFVDDETKSWEERFKALEAHHKEETQFLIKKVRELASASVTQLVEVLGREPRK